MALFQQTKKDPTNDVKQLMAQGFSDSEIMEEVSNRGYSSEQIHNAISMLGSQMPGQEEMPAQPAHYSQPEQQYSAGGSNESGNIYERIEEITEGIIDEKWDDLIAEVKKVLEWKEKIEGKQEKMKNDLQKLKEDFTVLHQAVLGKIEEYDNRMQEVGTELKAVGKVFKDVIPEFVDNVKELSQITGKIKEKKK